MLCNSCEDTGYIYTPPHHNTITTSVSTSAYLGNCPKCNDIGEIDKRCTQCGEDIYTWRCIKCGEETYTWPTTETNIP